MQNGDSEEARGVADHDGDEAATCSSDGAAVDDETVRPCGDDDDDDDEATAGRDDAEVTASDDGTAVAEPHDDDDNDEDPGSDAEQAAAGADERKPVVKKGDCVWTMYLPSTSGKETHAAPGNNYGCEHYKRKSKFVVSSSSVCLRD